MKDKYELRITEEGAVEAVYEDGLAELLGADEGEIRRASNVEWELSGWTVRSARDPELAICEIKGKFVVAVPNDHLRLALFRTREKALEEEVKHFWELL